MLEAVLGWCGSLFTATLQSIFFSWMMRTEATTIRTSLPLFILKHTRGQTAKQKQDCRAIYPAHHSCSKVRMRKTKLVQQKLNKSIAHRVMFTFHHILWYCAGNMNVHQISTFSTPAQQKVKLCSFQTLRMRKCTGHLLASCIYVWYWDGKLVK